MSVKGRALIIGGKSGIGAEVHRYLANHTDLKFHVPDSQELDVTYGSSIARAMSNGPFNYIVYSAGINQLAWVNDPKIGFNMEDTFGINCSGFVQVVSEHLQTFPDVGISAVAVSSDAATIPMRGSVAYCASKAALNAAVKVMARELAPLHRINAVAPGMVEGTPMTDYIDAVIPSFRGWTPDQARNYERQNVPTKRRATLAEVAETIAWVLTGPAQMTGAIIEINGGR